jgi:ABC-type sugar transport system ATPase subunit
MLEARGITKSYGGVLALRDASLSVRAGSVHALLGENGAGKSTLVKIIAGAVKPDAGELLLDGRRISFAHTADAARHGIAVVSQELSLFPDLDVLANLFPMREVRHGPFVARSAMAERAQPILEELGLRVSLRQTVSTLTLAERQLIEIAKALLTQPRVLILDEPTSALEARSTEALLTILQVLRERHVAVVYVTHILEEVMRLCDEVTVLRDGHPIMRGKPRSELTVTAIVEAMLGERGQAEVAVEATETGTVESAEGLKLNAVTVHGYLDSVSLEAKRGEVLGLAGLVGAGQLTVLELAIGIRQPDRGQVLLPGGRPVPRRLRDAIAAGVALISGDRRLGLMLDKPLWENVAQVSAVALAREGLLIRGRRLRDRARQYLRQLRIRAASVDQRTGLLSGGNQQKVMFAKWLETRPSVLLLDDPTRGIDVGAKAEMHALIRGIAGYGSVVILCSTDLDELVSIGDRVLVFYRGHICAELSGAALNKHTLLTAMNTGNLNQAARVTPIRKTCHEHKRL